MLGNSMTLTSVISHARLFFTGQPWNPWQMLVKPLGFAKPQLKITAVHNQLTSVIYD